METLIKQLAKMSTADLNELLRKVDTKRHQIIKEELDKKAEEDYPKPDELSQQEFNSLIARTKALFVGEKSKTTERLVLDINIENHMAWMEGIEPQFRETSIKVKSDRLHNSRALDRIAVVLLDYQTEFTKHLAFDANFLKMKKEISNLLCDIEEKEKDLGLKKDTIWEAVYERCRKFSRS